MDYSIEDLSNISLRKLQEEEEYLEQEIKNEDISYSGLKDIDAYLKLICIKFQIALQFIDKIETRQLNLSMQTYRNLAAEKSIAAVRMLEEIGSENISEDQKNLITESQEYDEAKRLFQMLLMRGGASFFESKIEDTKKTRMVAQVIARAIRKYTSPDDNYSRLFKTERLPNFFRKVVNIFFYFFAFENQQKPSYGIEEGEELTYSSEQMLMPVSQVIYYLEHEVLSGLEKKLQDHPGDAHLQQQIQSTREKIDEFKQLKFVPRSTPIVIEKGFYTDWWTGFTKEGELLVTVSLPVTFKSGTNLERVQELVQSEITRKLAGKGISSALDEDYAYLKGLESGKRGSSRTPSFRINAAKGFRILKSIYPFLKLLEDKKTFRKLITLVSQEGRKSSQKLFEQMILKGDNSLKQLR